MGRLDQWCSALVKADLGIVIGSGTDVSKETGRIVIIKDNIRTVITALVLGKKTISKIKQNLFWVFVYNIGLIPIAARVLVPFFGIGIFGWVPMPSELAMAMSSVKLIWNSLLLGRYKSSSQRKHMKREIPYPKTRKRI